ncbi:MAG: OmpA family protein [Syntrophobacterales bacterium]|jgi:outer membrane protein OmpA-like peptidoglycan-associated protein|nr:OmpA family protein [Syntrophobacterales bacterium]
MKKAGIVIVLSVFLLTGCLANRTQQGAVWGTVGGAAAGAIAGQAIGGNTKSTLLGAAIGAAIGGIGGAAIGAMMDQQERAMQEALAYSNAAAVAREGNLLSVTFKGDVAFDTNSATVKPGFHSEINRVATVLNQYPNTVMRIEGHTDNVGAEAYNMDLSIRRANAVKTMLVQRGVADGRMEVLGFGPSMPVANNNTEAGRQMNRRVEIRIAPQG